MSKVKLADTEKICYLMTSMVAVGVILDVRHKMASKLDHDPMVVRRLEMRPHECHVVLSKPLTHSGQNVPDTNYLSHCATMA